MRQNFYENLRGKSSSRILKDFQERIVRIFENSGIILGTWKFGNKRDFKNMRCFGDNSSVLPIL